MQSPFLPDRITSYNVCYTKLLRVKRYVASAVLSIDGNDLTTNWSAYPKNEGKDQTGYADLASDPTTGWISTQVTKNEVLVNSDTLHIYPNPTSMTYWSTYYKSEFV